MKIKEIYKVTYRDRLNNNTTYAYAEGDELDIKEFYSNPNSVNVPQLERLTLVNVTPEAIEEKTSLLTEQQNLETKLARIRSELVRQGRA